MCVRLVPIRLPRDCLRGWRPSFPEDAVFGKILVLFTRIFIHPNLELKKVPALNTLGKISIKTNNKQTKENDIQLPNTSHSHVCHQKLCQVKPTISIGTKSVRSLHEHQGCSGWGVWIQHCPLLAGEPELAGYRSRLPAQLLPKHGRM